ncbi:MAG: purine-nucleoside phosphorylase [Candidatus Magasanikbacteria bacterium]
MQRRSWENEMTERLSEKFKLAEAMRALGFLLEGFVPDLGIVLGSGMGHITDLLEGGQSCRFEDIPNCPTPTVEGHAGTFHWGWMAGLPVVIASGRVHLNEGYGVQEVAFMTRLMIMLGAEVVIQTHAVGSLTLNLVPGDVVLVRSQNGLYCPDPTSGRDALELSTSSFTTMESVHDTGLIEMAMQVGLRTGVSVHRGVSVFKMGRTFQTAAETHALAMVAQIVSMSVCAETMATAHLGKRVLDIALVTDLCLGLGSTEPVDHKEVLRVVESMSGPFGRLIFSIVAGIGARKKLAS